MADDMLQVSIIVPVHNAAETVAACVAGIMEQDYENIECILVENGSRDDSARVCKECADSSPRIRFLTSPVAGVSHARNLGLAEAKGDIIGFCDADDFLEPGAIRAVVNAFRQGESIVGVFGAFHIGRVSEGEVRRQYKGIKKQYLTKQTAIKLTLGCDDVMGSVWNKYYRADIAKQVLFDPGLSYCEDMHYNVKLLSGLEEATVAYTPHPLYCYVVNTQSVTHTASLFYGENDELKYITAMKRILADCPLSRRSASLVRMKIAAFAIDFLYRGDNTDAQRARLKQDVKENLGHFMRNMARAELGMNMKRLVKLALLAVK